MPRSKNNGTHVFFSPEEKAKLKTNAECCGISQSAYIRNLVNGIVPREAPPVVFQDLTAVFLEIATTMNEIASFAKETCVLDADAYAGLAHILFRSIYRIEEAVYQRNKVDVEQLMQEVKDRPETLQEYFIREHISIPDKEMEDYK